LEGRNVNGDGKPNGGESRRAKVFLARAFRLSLIEEEL
jgi:hypothetical protein